MLERFDSQGSAAMASHSCSSVIASATSEVLERNWHGGRFLIAD